MVLIGVCPLTAMSNNSNIFSYWCVPGSFTWRASTPYSPTLVSAPKSNSIVVPILNVKFTPTNDFSPIFEGFLLTPNPTHYLPNSNWACPLESSETWPQAWPFSLGRGGYLDCSPQGLFPFSVNQTQYIGSLCGVELVGVACVFEQTRTYFFHYLWPKEHKEHWSTEEGIWVSFRDSTLWTLIWTKWGGTFICWCWWERLYYPWTPSSSSPMIAT